MSVKIVLICEKCGKELSGEPGANTEIGRVVDRAVGLGWRWPDPSVGAWAIQFCPECVAEENKRKAVEG